jgi:hypothetical protein
MSVPQRLPFRPAAGGADTPTGAGPYGPPREPTILRLPGADSAVPAEETPPAAHEGLIDFLWKVHDSTEQAIRFADSKAAMVVVAASGAMSALYASKLHHCFLGVAPVNCRLTEALKGAGAAVAFLLLAAGLLQAAWAVMPRLQKKPVAGFLFWEGILAHGNCDDFAGALRGQGAAQVSRHLQDDLFCLSRVCRAKYRHVLWSMRLTVAGGALGGLVTLLAG